MAFRAVQVHQLVEIAVVIADQGVEIFLFRFEHLPHRGFEIQPVALPGRAVQVAQHGRHAEIQIGQFRAAVLQLQQRQLAVADVRLPGADVVVVESHVGQRLALLAQQQADGVGQPAGIHFLLHAFELFFQGGQLLPRLFELPRGLGDVLGQAFAHLGQGGVVLGQLPHRRVGLGGFPAGFAELALRLALAASVGDVAPLLDALLDQRNPPRRQVALQGKQFRGRFVLDDLPLVGQDLALDVSLPGQQQQPPGGRQRGRLVGRRSRLQLLLQLGQAVPRPAQILGKVHPPRRPGVRLGFQLHQLVAVDVQVRFRLGNRLVDLRERDVRGNGGIRLRGHGRQRAFGFLQLVGGGSGELVRLRRLGRPRRGRFQLGLRRLVGLFHLGSDGLVHVGHLVELFQFALQSLGRRFIGGRIFRDALAVGERAAQQHAKRD